MSGMRFRITGLGKAAPKRIVDSALVEQQLGLPEGWIRRRTGIAQRHHADENETAATLSLDAGRMALQRAGLGAEELDLIVVATGTPDYLFPPTATLVADQLGAGAVGAFDIEAACAGFVYALVSAGSLLSTGAAKRALVLGVDLPSKLLDPADAATVAVFGDGCGAAVIEATDEGAPVAVKLGSDGSHPEDIFVHGGGSKHPRPRNDEVFPRIVMKGREVYKYAVRAMSRIGSEAQAADHDLVIMHQANKRILDECAAAIGLTPDQIYSNVERYGNTSAGSVAIALCEAWEEEKLDPGDRLLLVGFGAGYTWATASIPWTLERPRRSAEALAGAVESR